MVMPKQAEATDADLVLRVQNGETEAYGTLVRRYQDRVYNTCWRVCGNLEEARDLTQQAFLNGLERIAGFKREAGFYTWIFRIAVNLSLTHRRRAKTRRTTSLDSAAVESQNQADPLTRLRKEAQTEDPIDSAARKELQRAAAEGLASLDETQRAIIVLRDIEGFDYDDISAILEVPRGTVKSRLHRARAALRDALVQSGALRAQDGDG